MPLIRNPFRRTPGDQVTEDASRPPISPRTESDKSIGSRPSPLLIRPNGATQPREYKLSEINDSGVYLPPSPTEKPKFWTARSHTSTTSSSHRSALTDSDNAFTISRESFDTYRRSFDISARSPVIDNDAQRPRQSLDARRLRIPSAGVKEKPFNPPEPHPEDQFEDVGLNDDAIKPKKTGIFARFGHSSNESSAHANTDSNRPTSSHFGSQLFARKRGASGQGAELGSMSDSPMTESPDAKSGGHREG